MDFQISKFIISRYLMQKLMKISVSLMTGHKINSKRQLSGCATPMDALAALEISPETVIVVRKGKPIPLDENLNDGDDIQIIGVVTGG